MKSGKSSKALLLASQRFAHEQRWQSWWHLCSTIALFAGLTWISAGDLPWLCRVPSSLLAGLTLVRLFVLYHDYEHGTILKHSLLADAIMGTVSVILLNPPSVWKRSHDHHHFHNSRSFGENVGSFPLMTVEDFRAASSWEKWRYSLQRHPLTICCGYLTVFLFGMCIGPLIANPRRHLDAALSILCHGLLLAWIGWHDLGDLVLVALLPCSIGSAVGAYLFYAQHNFPDVRLRTGSDWDYVSAALESSSYIRMSVVMRWFTGNIGYHHVHHLNAHIPFYRLPEAMDSIPELRSPAGTTLGFRDIQKCLRLKLWDPKVERLVPWPSGRANDGDFAQQPRPAKAA